MTKPVLTEEIIDRLLFYVAERSKIPHCIAGEVDFDTLRILCHYARIGLLHEGDVAKAIQDGCVTSAERMELNEYRRLYGDRFVQDSLMRKP